MADSKTIEKLESIPRMMPFSKYSGALDRVFRSRSLKDLIASLKNPKKYIENDPKIEDLRKRVFHGEDKKNFDFYKRLMEEEGEKEKEIEKNQKKPVIREKTVSRKVEIFEPGVMDPFKYNPNYNSIRKRVPCVKIMLPVKEAEELKLKQNQRNKKNLKLNNRNYGKRIIGSREGRGVMSTEVDTEAVGKDVTKSLGSPISSERGSIKSRMRRHLMNNINRKDNNFDVLLGENYNKRYHTEANESINTNSDENININDNSDKKIVIDKSCGNISNRSNSRGRKIFDKKQFILPEISNNIEQKEISHSIDRNNHAMRFSKYMSRQEFLSGIQLGGQVSYLEPFDYKNNGKNKGIDFSKMNYRREKDLINSHSLGVPSFCQYTPKYDLLEKHPAQVAFDKDINKKEGKNNKLYMLRKVWGSYDDVPKEYLLVNNKQLD